MKAIIQRVLSASVTVDDQLISSIKKGLLVFAAVAPGDDERDVESLAAKVLKLKCWDDENGGKWKKSVVDISGEILCVSQFTLLANTKKGNKPDFHGAMPPDLAKSLYDLFVQKVKTGYQEERVQDGVFQAMMQVGIVNDGPVTLELVSGERPPGNDKAAAAEKWAKKQKGKNERMKGVVDEVADRLASSLIVEEGESSKQS